MKEKADRSVIIWLLTGCLLIFVMVVIGGITRLTHSGLSMVDWNLFMGAIPPLNENQWIETFNNYKQFPEYQKVNFTFTLEEFKSIFFWEYLHRLIGRLIGLVFIIPFVYFLIRKRITGRLFKECLIILGMGAFQGFLGWWMVKSGLVDNPDVSHYRLAIHLITAFVTFAYTFWVALKLMYKQEVADTSVPMRRGLIALLIVLILQIVYGALVAGLDAGKVYNTWPKMGELWVAESVTAMSPFLSNFVDGIAGVQFVHRYLAFIVVGLVLYLVLKSVKYNPTIRQKRSLKVLMVIVFTQFMLGIFTLLYGVPVWLGVAHQIGAFFLLGAVVIGLNAYRKAKV